MAALGWRLVGWGDAWLNPDEGTYYAMATWPSWADFWAELGANAHPPLFYLLERLLAFVTVSHLALRVPALVGGVVAVWGLALATRRLAGARAAIVAAVLAAAAPGLVIHSQLIRPYTLQLALLAFALWLFLRHLEEKRLRDLAGAAALWTAAVLTHYASVIVVLACAAVAAASSLRRRPSARELAGMALAFGAPLATFALLYALHARSLSGSALAKATFVQLARLFPDGPAALASSVVGVHVYLFGPALGGAATVLSGIGLAVAAHRGSRFLLVLATSALALALGLALAERYPLGASRHSLYLAIVLVPLVATAVDFLLSGGARRAFAGAVLLAVVWALPGPLDGDSHFIPLETPVRAASVQPVAARLERARTERSVVLLDAESRLVLAPLLPGVGRVPTTLGPGVSRFDWGESDLLVAHVWRFSADASAVEHPLHVVAFLRYLDDALPQLRLSTRADGLLLFAGWGAHLYRDLRGVNRQLGTACLSGFQLGRGAGSLRIDFARCLRGAPPEARGGAREDETPWPAGDDRADPPPAGPGGSAVDG